MVMELLSGESDGTSESEPAPEQVRTREEYGPLVRVVLAIRRSFMVFTIFLGFVMILSGVVVEYAFTNQGVLAAMLVIWGVSAIVFGALGYGLVILLGLR